MMGEATLYQAMAAQVAPVPVYRLHAPQLDDQHPDKVPYVVFSREQFNGGDMTDFCAADAALTDSYIVDCFDVSYAGARELNRQMTAVFKAFQATPESVAEDWEQETRVYRISSLFTLSP